MGYDTTRFGGDVIDEELICVICNGVFLSPMWFPKCQHTFCSACIHQWFEQSTPEQQRKTCPVDRQAINVDDLQPAPRILTILLNRLKISCDNAEHGCDVVVSLEQLGSHVNNHCEHNPQRPVQCVEGCGLVMPWDQLNKHHCVRDLRLRVADLEAGSCELKEKLEKATETLSELSEELYQLKVTLKLFDTQSLLSQLATTFLNSQKNSPSSTSAGLGGEGMPLILLPVENEKDRFRKWAKCLPSARVNRWGALISTPDQVLRVLLRRALTDAGCPDDVIATLMENSHEKAYPSGLNTLENRRKNASKLHQYVCKRLHAKQVVICVRADNEHMGDLIPPEPAGVFLFGHGVENAL